MPRDQPPRILHPEMPLDPTLQQIPQLRRNPHHTCHQNCPNAPNNQPNHRHRHQSPERPRPGLPRRNRRRQFWPAYQPPHQISPDVTRPNHPKHKRYIRQSNRTTTQPQQRQSPRPNIQQPNCHHPRRPAAHPMPLPPHRRHARRDQPLKPNPAQPNAPQRHRHHYRRRRHARPQIAPVGHGADLGKVGRKASAGARPQTPPGKVPGRQSLKRGVMSEGGEVRVQTSPCPPRS